MLWIRSLRSSVWIFRLDRHDSGSKVEVWLLLQKFSAWQWSTPLKHQDACKHLSGGNPSSSPFPLMSSQAKHHHISPPEPIASGKTSEVEGMRSPWLSRSMLTPRGVKDPRPSHPTMSEIGGNCAQPRSHPTPTTHTRTKLCTWLGAARDEHTVRAGKFAFCVCVCVCVCV